MLVTPVRVSQAGAPLTLTSSTQLTRNITPVSELAQAFCCASAARFRLTSSFVATAAASPGDESCLTRSLRSLPADVPCDEIARSDSLRAHAAAAMALCDIRTASEFRLPKECTDWEQARRGATTKACVG